MSAEPEQRETLGLGLLSGAIYFVHGIGDRRPARSPSRSARCCRTPATTPRRWGAFAAVTALPRALKPLFGLVTDTVPLLGAARRRSASRSPMSRSMRACVRDGLHGSDEA